MDWVVPWCSFWSSGKGKVVLVEPCEGEERMFCFCGRFGCLVEMGGVSPKFSCLEITGS